MARGRVGRFPDGAQARRLLHRLLLVSHGLAPRGGGDEPAVGRRHRGLSLARKGGSGGRPVGPSRGGGARRMGSVAGCGSALTILQPTEGTPSGCQPNRRRTQEVSKEEGYSAECVEGCFCEVRLQDRAKLPPLSR